MPPFLKALILAYINNQIEHIKLDELFDQVRENMLVDKYKLVVMTEALYYRALILNHDDSKQLMMFLDMLNDQDCKLTALGYMYIIYQLDHITKKSDPNLYI